MERALRTIVTTRPFNNVGKLHHAVGKAFPDELGGNCVKLAEELIDVLLKEGEADEGDLIDITDNDSHTGALVTKDGKKFFLDPALLQLKPVCVSDMLRRQPVTVPALPFIGGVYSDMEVTRYSENILGIARKVEAKPISFTFSRSFNLRKTRRTDPNPDHYNALASTNNLLFRFPLDSGEARVRRSIRDGEVDCLFTGHSGETTRYPLANFTVDSDQILTCVERKFGVQRQELYRYLEEGIGIYKELVGEEEEEGEEEA